MMIFLNLTRYNSNGKYFEGDLAISRELIKAYYEEPVNVHYIIMIVEPGNEANHVHRLSFTFYVHTHTM